LIYYAIEVTQLYKAPWINAIRNATLRALALSSGFLWSDLLAYALGVLVAFVVRLFF
jgi:hypothetical protein